MRTPSLRSTRTERRCCRNAARAPRLRRDRHAQLRGHAACGSALHTDRIHAAAQRRRSSASASSAATTSRVRQKADYIRCAAKTIRRYGSASATTGSRYSIFLPATGPTAYSPYATNPTPSATARWNRYGKRLHRIESRHGDKKAACRPNAGRLPYISVGHDNGLRGSSFSNIKIPPRRTA